VILALRRYASERDTTSSGRLIDIPFLETWKESVNRLRTDRRPVMNVWTEKAGTEVSRYDVGVWMEEARRLDR
jgi:hypothetical protein